LSSGEANPAASPSALDPPPPPPARGAIAAAGNSEAAEPAGGGGAPPGGAEPTPISLDMCPTSLFNRLTFLRIKEYLQEKMNEIE
jgi:hypothetical protein